MKSSWTGGLPVCQTVFLVFLSLLWTGSLAAQEVFYRFEAPCFVTGPPGATRTFEAVVVMDSRFPPGTPGSEGWTVSLTADGGVVTGVTQRAFVVPTNSGDRQLAQSSFQLAGDGAFPDGRRGGFAVVTLSFAKDIYVLPRAVARIARVNVQTTIPAGGECGSVTLRFEDGVVGRGQPVPNAITRRGMTVIPGLEGKEVPVCPVPSTVSCPDPHLLQVGSPVAFVLTPSDPVRICKLNVAASGGIVSFSFTDPQASHWNILRGRWGAPPTSALYDKAVVGRQATQRLVMPLDRTGDLFVMVQGNIDLGRFHQGTLLATREELAVERMSSSFSSNADGEEVQLICFGAGFLSGPLPPLSAELVSTGEPIAASSVDVFSDGEALLSFDISGVPTGSYALRVARGNKLTATLENAFTVVDTQEGPLLAISFEGERHVRVGRSTTLSLRVTNLGDGQTPTRLFCLTTDDGSLLSVDGDPDEDPSTRSDRLLLLPVDSGGTKGTLAPGRTAEAVFSVRPPLCAECTPVITAELFTPTSADLTRWDNRKPIPPLTGDQWLRVWPRLSVVFGATWIDFEKGLGQLAERLCRQLLPAYSVDSLVRLPIRESLGPGHALVGRLRDRNTLAPIVGATIAALEGGVVKSSAVTQDRGVFALRCLDAQVKYIIEGVDLDVGNVSITLEGDRFDLELLGKPSPNGIVPDNPNCALTELPARAISLFPDGTLFTPAGSIQLQMIQAVDPNEKKGSPDGGNADGKDVDLGVTLNYKIFFENMSDSTAAAQTVTVCDNLDPHLDWTSLNLLGISYGEDSAAKFFMPLDDDDTGFCAVFPEVQVTFPARDGNGDPIEVTETVSVTIEGRVDLALGRVEWRIESSETANPFGGFLPPNDATGRGEGWVSFSARPLQTLDEGDGLNNDALISFDPPDQGMPGDPLFSLETNTVVHTVNFFVPPVEPILPVPRNDARVDRDVTLMWSALRAETHDLTLWRGEQAEVVEEALGLTVPAFPPAPLEFDTLYTWQVTVHGRLQNQTVMGPVWRFTTLPRPRVPPLAPALVSPTDNATNVIRTPDFRWKVVEGAAWYEVFVWRPEQGDPEGPIFRKSTPPFRPMDFLDPDTDYKWKVDAVNASGGASSDVFSFRTTRDIVRYQRGNANADATTDISDAIFMLGFLFLGGRPPTCEKTLDVNDDGRKDISDAVNLLNHLFLGGLRPAPPFRECSEDPTEDDLDCESFAAC